jgi:hypothetical protein
LLGKGVVTMRKILALAVMALPLVGCSPSPMGPTTSPVIITPPSFTPARGFDHWQATSTVVGVSATVNGCPKIYGEEGNPEKRYSPAVCLDCKAEVVAGQPDPKHISSSYVERQNLTMRMSIRRFTRLTNAFSKKIENHAAAVALYFMYYNFRRVHQTLRVTPAMEAGVSDHVWSIEEIVRLLEGR